MTEKQYADCVYAVAVLLGDYSLNRKYAAILILKYYFGSKFLRFLLEDKTIYPYDRSDCRVREWTNKVKAAGNCALCNSTENLEAHHVIKWADYPQGRIDINNGLCLCIDCHTKEHEHDQSYSLMKARNI